jgi:hypothetical protein
VGAATAFHQHVALVVAAGRDGSRTDTRRATGPVAVADPDTANPAARVAMRTTRITRRFGGVGAITSTDRLSDDPVRRL